MGANPNQMNIQSMYSDIDLDANGILKVSARDLATGRAQEIVISSNSNLSEEEIREAIRDAEAYAQTDGLRREAMEARNEAEGLVIQVKEALRVCGKDLNRQDRNRIKADLAELERLLHKYRPEKLEPEAAPELSSAAERVKASAAVLMPGRKGSSKVPERWVADCFSVLDDRWKSRYNKIVTFVSRLKEGGRSGESDKAGALGGAGLFDRPDLADRHLPLRCQDGDRVWSYCRCLCFGLLCGPTAFPGPGLGGRSAPACAGA